MNDHITTHLKKNSFTVVEKHRNNTIMNNTHSMSIKSLSLMNFATFKNELIDFNDGLNCIIGETGSGKSLIIDALHFILGTRADKKFIRKECDYASIEATLTSNNPFITKYFDDIGYPFEDEIIIKRVIYNNGKSKCFLNFQKCSLSILQAIAKQFIDLVGQFENQRLLDETYQLQLLDKYSKNDLLRQKFQSVYQELKSKYQNRENLNEKFKLSSERLDYINYQLNELSSIDLSIETEKELISEKKRILNLESRNQTLDKIAHKLDGNTDQVGIISSLGSISSEVSQVFPEIDISKTIDAAISNLTEFSYDFSKLHESTENSLERLEEIVNQLDTYQKLKNKFSVNTEELVQIVQKFTTEKEEINQLESLIEITNNEINELENTCYQLANKLHDIRLKNGKQLSTSLSNSVRELGMTGATIHFDLVKAQELNSFGISKLSLNAETNTGEGFYKIKDIASGGELSRILLALRQIFSESDSISIFLFDEIDTGIGGETAMLVGSALKAVSQNSQVIAITHLPQIASFSDQMIKVSKAMDEKENRTFSKVKHIDADSIKEEVIGMNPL